MDEIERKITDALGAEAALVTEDSLRLPDHLERPGPRRWPALVAAAGVLTTAAAVTAGILLAGNQSQPQPMPPADTTTPVTTTQVPTTSQSTPTSAASSTRPSTGTTTTTAQALPRCGGKPCQVVQTVRIGADTLEVLAAPSTEQPGSFADWKIRVRGGAELAGAPTFDSFVDRDSLRCATVARRPVCLLHTFYLGDSDTSLGIIRDGTGWRFTGATFPTPYGALRVDVRDLGEDSTLEVVSVESRFLSQGGGPERELWTATVWRWDGTRLGCVPRVATKEELPGWPTVTPDPSTLDTQHCFS